MVNTKKIIAFIPARGGSKGIPRKNIKNFRGKPLIAWAIETARSSKLLDRTIVSTDSKEIAKVANKHGAETPFMQPEALAQDSSRLEDVMRYAIEWLKKNENYKTDAMVLLLATNPLRESTHLDEAVRLFLKTKTDCVISASEVPAAHNPLWVLKPSANNPHILVNAANQHINDIPPRRQLLPKYYTKNDILFIFKTENLYLGMPGFFGKKQELYPMSEFYDADINTPEEWILMENKFRRITKRFSRHPL